MHSFTLDFVKTMEKSPNFTFPLIIIGNIKYKVSEMLESTNLEVPHGTLDEKNIYCFKKYFATRIRFYH